MYPRYGDDLENHENNWFYSIHRVSHEWLLFENVHKMELPSIEICTGCYMYRALHVQGATCTGHMYRVLHVQGATCSKQYHYPASTLKLNGWRVNIFVLWNFHPLVFQNKFTPFWIHCLSVWPPSQYIKLLNIFAPIYWFLYFAQGQNKDWNKVFKFYKTPITYICFTISL